MRFKILNEMAFNRDKAIEKIKHETETYSEHLIKCILYKNKTNSLWHWCDELANKIDIVNKIKLKSGGKFSQKFYEDEFFLADGDCPSDFEITLKDFKRDFRFKYPDFEITSKMIEEVSRSFNDISLYFSNILCRENNKNKEWFRNALLDYFEEEIDSD